MSPRLYCPQALEAGTSMVLPEAAAHHAVRVLRLKRGDRLTLFNGEGGEFAAELAAISPRAVSVQVGAHDPIERESPLAVTLVQAIVGTDRMDYAMQKAVELGAVALQPVVCERSVGRLDAVRAARRVAHWQQIAVASCEQCGRNRVPMVHPLTDFRQWLAQPSKASTRFLLLPEGDTRLRAAGAPAGAIEIMAGPEGGFTVAEVEAAKRAGWHGVRLGPRILRSESAGAAALAALSALWGDYA